MSRGDTSARLRGRTESRHHSVNIDPEMPKSTDHAHVIGIVAGEASGDQLGAHLMRSLLARNSRLHFVGIGGPKMEAAGAEILFPMEKLAVRGYVEVIKHYLEIVGIRRRLRKYFLRHR